MTGPSAIPYHNLILTGYMGVGKIAVGRGIAARMGVVFVDLDSELEVRQGMPADEIRQLFGESRLRILEDDLCREMSLRRSAVISVSGSTLLDTASRERLLSSGPALVLTCALDEILRRLHASQGARFHDPRARLRAVNQVRRERQIHQIPGLETLDTTRLAHEQVIERAIAFWHERAALTV
jgi:shikimate kinase